MKEQEIGLSDRFFKTLFLVLTGMVIFSLAWTANQDDGSFAKGVTQGRKEMMQQAVESGAARWKEEVGGEKGFYWNTKESTELWEEAYCRGVSDGLYRRAEEKKD